MYIYTTYTLPVGAAIKGGGCQRQHLTSFHARVGLFLCPKSFPWPENLPMGFLWCLLIANAWNVHDSYQFLGCRSFLDVKLPYKKPMENIRLAPGCSPMQSWWTATRIHSWSLFDVYWLRLRSKMPNRCPFWSCTHGLTQCVTGNPGLWLCLGWLFRVGLFLGAKRFFWPENLTYGLFMMSSDCESSKRA
jgi:hypothetical protein